MIGVLLKHCMYEKCFSIAFDRILLNMSRHRGARLFDRYPMLFRKHAILERLWVERPKPYITSISVVSNDRYKRFSEDKYYTYHKWGEV